MFHSNGRWHRGERKVRLGKLDLGCDNPLDLVSNRQQPLAASRHPPASIGLTTKQKGKTKIKAGKGTKGGGARAVNN